MEMKFTEIFVDLCDDKNQIKLANEIGINQSQISRYLKGTIPNTKSIVKICDYFNCSIDYIVGLNDKTYKVLKNGYDNKVFYERYQKALKDNNTNHYKLSKQGIVCETSLRLWKKGMLPQFDVLFNIAITLCTSIDYLLGRMDKI